MNRINLKERGKRQSSVKIERLVLREDKRELVLGVGRDTWGG